jgi:transcriptional regulator NrdR family protein
MEALKALDQIAYVRFASVYREFSDVSQFVDTLQSLEDAPKDGGAAVLRPDFKSAVGSDV